MERRDFLEKSGCGFAGLVAAPILLGPDMVQGQERRRRYKIEIEIYETREGLRCHHVGQKFKYPEDWGKICAWLRPAMIQPIRLLEAGVTLPWKYAGTPYEKVIDPDGITTEYIRCPDPTADLVAKIIRTNIG